MKKAMKKAVCAASAAACATLAIWTAWGNTALELNSYTISGEALPEAFSGFRIAHISDLHNTRIGAGNEKLLAMLKAAAPDMIAITGDLIDSRRTDIETALAFAQEAQKIAPCYYAAGNHEARIPVYDRLKEGLKAAGVTVLENRAVRLEKWGEHLTLLGVNDPSFETGYFSGDSAAVMKSKLQALTGRSGGYTILLSHRPELFDIYVEYGMDLVLSGHTHGGQFRLPFVGGLMAPSQGIFPKYDAGLFSSGGTNMLVSRGIGNSLFPFRFNNRPEVILVVLQGMPRGCPRSGV